MDAVASFSEVLRKDAPRMCAGEGVPLTRSSGGDKSRGGHRLAIAAFVAGVLLVLAVNRSPSLCAPRSPEEDDDPLFQAFV